jgi:hypothetical protein
MSTKAKGTSVVQKLTSLAAKNGVPYEYLATEFLIERLACRLLSEKTLYKVLVFKGGFVGLKVYDSKRYTVDLDALLKKSEIDATLGLARAAAEHDLDDGVWFRYEAQVDLAAQGEYGGIRQIYRAGFGEVLKKLTKAQIINFDLGLGDPVKPIAAKTTSLLLDEEISWSIYPIETIVAEKLHALVDRGSTNSRSKDIHDLAVFLPRVEKDLLIDALKKCFAYRKTALPPSFFEMMKSLDTTVLGRGWQNAVLSLKPAPKFQPTFEQLLSLLERLEI